MAHDVPQQVYLEYLILRREVLEKVSILLTQQYEMAKIDESKQNISFQVIDLPRVMDSPIRPKVQLNIFVGGIVSILVALFYAFFADYLAYIKEKRRA